MSRTMHFGRDVLAAPDVDLEDLLSALAPSEVTQLVDEMAADPDDKHLPVMQVMAWNVRETVQICQKKSRKIGCVITR